MKYYITIFILITGFINIYGQDSDYMIKGRLISCSKNKDKPSGKIKLLKDSIVIDSIETYHKTLFGYRYAKNAKFKFKGLQNGSYKIKYNSCFEIIDFPEFKINGTDLKGIEICYDKLPEKLYESETILDRLEVNDTLHINVYIAAGGEFGGYDEGLWITKKHNKLKGRFYSLPKTYGMQRDSAKVIATYKKNAANVKPITDEFNISQNDIIQINRFLTEIRYYKEHWIISNAPEHFFIYDKNETIFRIKNRLNYKPYIDLRNKIKNGF